MILKSNFIDLWVLKINTILFLMSNLVILTILTPLIILVSTPILKVLILIFNR